MRYCGNCGASFEPDTLMGRVCPSCGAPINRTGDLLRDEDSSFSQTPTQQSQSVPDAELFSALPTRPVDANGDPPTVLTTSRRFPGNLVKLLALLALALALVGGSALLLGNTPLKQHLNLPPLPLGGNLGGAQAAATRLTTPGGGGAQPSPANGAPSTPLASPLASTTPGTPITTTVTPGAGTPTTGAATPTAESGGTPTPEATSTIPPEPDQPTLAIEPTHISLGVCVAASAQFTVANSGGGTLQWIASASSTLYSVSPQGGSLTNGQQQTVTVSDITLNGTVTVTAAGSARNTPQTVTITCGA